MLLISQLSLNSGIPVKTLRYYEKFGLIKCLTKTGKSNSYKYYDELTLEKLELIEEGRSLGLSLSELSDLIKAWYNSRISNEKRIEVLKSQLNILEEKESKIRDVKSRLQLLISEMEKFT